MAESFKAVYTVVGPSLADQFPIVISIRHVGHFITHPAYSNSEEK
jgi:hypothetical protein